MTDTLPPLTSAELADLKAAYVGVTGEDEELVLRLIAMIERQRKALEAVQPYFEGEHVYDHPHCILLREALAATEPKP